MKRIIIFFAAALSFASCSSVKSCTNIGVAEEQLKQIDSLQKEKEAIVHRQDSIQEDFYTWANQYRDSLYSVAVELSKRDQAGYKQKYDSVLVINDTLAKRLLHARLVLKNVQYYINIAYRNPSQRKFLTGWIRRALE